MKAIAAAATTIGRATTSFAISSLGKDGAIDRKHLTKQVFVVPELFQEVNETALEAKEGDD